MYDVGQLVRIRERIWQVLEDHTAQSGRDHILVVRGEEKEVRGVERTFIYRPVADHADDGELIAEDFGLEKVEALTDPELLWKPGASTSQWERLHTAYRLSSTHSANYLLGLLSSRLHIEPYQLAPVLHVMSAPQQRFLLAEDVGMGKTIEAGLIMLELIARGRGDRILIVVPAALQDQWADELQDKFGLTDFKILDSDYLSKDLIPHLPPGANPWYYASRVITSIDFAKQERVSRALKKTRWDIVVIDEAHYLAESGNATKPITTDRSRFGEMIAQRCDSLLLLTATPHNGYAQGFYSLLRLLDDARFASAEDLRREMVEKVVIRRSKKQIFMPDGSHKFKDRKVEHIYLSIDSREMTLEKRLYLELTKYINRHWNRAKKNPGERATVGFAMMLLKKRFISSMQAIRISLETRKNGLTKEKVDPNAEQGLLKSYQSGIALTDPQRERVERQAIVRTSEHDVEAEVRDLERLLTIARRITPDSDPKAARLKQVLDTFCKAQGRKVIVFTEYKDTLDYLYDYLSEHGYDGRIAVMHGHLNRQARNTQEHLFYQPETDILLATDAASEGLNFQHGCWTVIHNELPWNPNRLEQRNGRVDRWGQKQEVEIYNMILEGTLEGDILRRLQDKLTRIREQLGTISDVLSVTASLDLDTLLMDGAEKYEEKEVSQGIDDLDDQVEQALREGEEALEACRAQFLIDPSAFRTEHYDKVAEVRAQTERALPSNTEVENFVTSTLPLLGGQASKQASSDALWTLNIPSSLWRTGVQHYYAQVTFERDTALGDNERPPTIEYIAPGHPLLQGLITAVKNDARTTQGLLAGRMAVRVLAGVPGGFLFTYLGRWQDKRGVLAAEEIIPLFLGLDGKPMFPSEAAMLLKAPALPRNAPPQLLSETYEPLWLARREQALPLASQYSSQRANEIAIERKPQLEILRHDIEVWQHARRSWAERTFARHYQDDVNKQLKIDVFMEKDEKARERALAAAETRRQKSLRQEINIITMRQEQRAAEISAMEQIVPLPPEAIGALIIIPAEEC